jgi:hypothetical protein
MPIGLPKLEVLVQFRQVKVGVLFTRTSSGKRKEIS